MARDSFPDLSSRQLRAVLAVAEYRSFVAAASSLKMSQPALTRAIKQIEAELGVLLFSRSTRQVTITDAGKEFAAVAERLLSDLKISVENLRGLADQPRGQIVVASVVSLANAVLPALIADYRTRFPGIELHLREGLHSAVIDEVRGGVADFGIGYVDDAPKSFITENFGVESFYVVLPRVSAWRGARRSSCRQWPTLRWSRFPVESAPAGSSMARLRLRGFPFDIR